MQQIDTAEPVLSVQNLHVRFDTRDGVVRAVNGASLVLGKGEVLGVVGESGCGKSVLSLSIMQLLPQPPARIESGSIQLGQRDLLALTKHQMRAVRGSEISMIFQEPMTSLNPVFSIGYQMTEPLMLHKGLSKAQANDVAVEYLDLVRIPDARRRLTEYPYQLSGGMRQRVMIAMALCCQPKILIADEPTTALDVTVQMQILTLLRELTEELGTSIILITHDLGVVAEVADRVVVMYAGRVVEEAPVKELFRAPMHPYTRGLLAARPQLHDAPGVKPAARLTEIPGRVPSLRDEIVGCSFAPRCSFAVEHCFKKQPPFELVSPSHFSACWETERVKESDHARP